MSNNTLLPQNTAATRVKTPVVQLYHGAVPDVVRSIAPARRCTCSGPNAWPRTPARS